MRYTVLLFIYFTSTLLFASPPIEWVQTISSLENVEYNDLCVDNEGNIIATGYFNANSTFNSDSLIISKGAINTFVQKLAPNGTQIWLKTLGGKGECTGTSVASDKSGHLFITGDFNDTITFSNSPNTLISTGGKDIFILHLDKNGNLVWFNNLEGEPNRNEFSDEIHIDVNDNIILCGTFNGKVDFDPSDKKRFYTSVGSQDAFTIALTTKGALKWINVIQPSYWIYMGGVTSDRHGNIYVTGYFEGAADFDLGINPIYLTSYGSNDVFIQKFGPNGQLKWAKSFGNTTFESSQSIAVDNSSNIYILGYFSGSTDFNPDRDTTSNIHHSSEFGDIYINKLDQNGNYIWSKIIGGNITEYGQQIKTDNKNNLYVTGYFSGTCDFDPGEEKNLISSKGKNDSFIEKLDSSGNLLWVNSYGGSSYDGSNTLVLDNKNNVYLAGFYSEEVHFSNNITKTASNGIDGFLLKLNQCEADTITPDISILPDIIDYCSITPQPPTATSSCGTVISGESNVTFPITKTDTTLITWTYTANNGKTISQTQRVLIQSIDSTIEKICAPDNCMLISNVDEENFTYRWYDCNTPNTPLTENKKSQYRALKTGSYAVDINYKSCRVTTECKEVLITGEEKFSENLMSLYPNPTTDIVYIKHPYSSIRVTLFNTLGEVLETKMLHNVSNTIHLNNYPSGIYFINIETNNHHSTITN